MPHPAGGFFILLNRYKGNIDFDVHYFENGAGIHLNRNGEILADVKMWWMAPGNVWFGPMGHLSMQESHGNWVVSYDPTGEALERTPFSRIPQIIQSKKVTDRLGVIEENLDASTSVEDLFFFLKHSHQSYLTTALVYFLSEKEDIFSELFTRTPEPDSEELELLTEHLWKENPAAMELAAKQALQSENDFNKLFAAKQLFENVTPTPAKVVSLLNQALTWDDMTPFIHSHWSYLQHKQLISEVTFKALIQRLLQDYNGTENLFSLVFWDYPGHLGPMVFNLLKSDSQHDQLIAEKILLDLALLDQSEGIFGQGWITDAILDQLIFLAEGKDTRLAPLSALYLSLCGIPGHFEELDDKSNHKLEMQFLKTIAALVLAQANKETRYEAMAERALQSLLLRLAGLYETFDQQQLFKKHVLFPESLYKRCVRANRRLTVKVTCNSFLDPTTSDTDRRILFMFLGEIVSPINFAPVGRDLLDQERLEALSPYWQIHAFDLCSTEISAKDPDFSKLIPLFLEAFKEVEGQDFPNMTPWILRALSDEELAAIAPFFAKTRCLYLP